MTSADLVARLRGTAEQLRNNMRIVEIAGGETSVRVKSPELLLADLDEAADALEASARVKPETEPAAWAPTSWSGEGYVYRHKKDAETSAGPAIPLYAAPRRLPRLTVKMMRAACRAHYISENIDGVSVSSHGVDYSFRQAFQHMWGGVRAALSDGEGRR